LRPLSEVKARLKQYEEQRDGKRFVASYFGRGKEIGIVTKGFAVDMSAVRDRKRRMVSGEINAHLDNYERSGAELIIGSGRFIGRKTLEPHCPVGQLVNCTGPM